MAFALVLFLVCLRSREGLSISCLRWWTTIREWLSSYWERCWSCWGLTRCLPGCSVLPEVEWSTARAWHSLWWSSWCVSSCHWTCPRSLLTNPWHTVREILVKVLLQEQVAKFGDYSLDLSCACFCIAWAQVWMILHRKLAHCSSETEVLYEEGKDDSCVLAVAVHMMEDPDLRCIVCSFSEIRLMMLIWPYAGTFCRWRSVEHTLIIVKSITDCYIANYPMNGLPTKVPRDDILYQRSTKKGNN